MSDTDQEPYNTRRASEMERYVTVAPTVQEGFPDAHNVFLQVTNQRFCVTPYACETKADAEWTRDMLCVALAKIAADAVLGHQQGTTACKVCGSEPDGGRPVWCNRDDCPNKKFRYGQPDSQQGRQTEK